MKKNNNQSSITSKNIICHIIGLDEIHKNQLLKKLESQFRIIDLDKIQQLIYYNLENTDDWKRKMISEINRQIERSENYPIILIGFNIYPKDYRLKIDFNFRNISLNSSISNRIICKSSPEEYASCSIKFYLENYSSKIIDGKFPLQLLDRNYIISKYTRFVNYYSQLNYCNISFSKMESIIQSLNQTFNKLNNSQIVYVATSFRCKDLIPIMANQPIEGFLNKQEAIENLRRKINRKIPIYVYKISADKFDIIDGKLESKSNLCPLEEESLLL
jgi:hypothetical protein